jgi:nitrogen fixation NifU-like protein
VPALPQTALEHFRSPQNVGELPPPAVTSEVTNPACGDTLRLSVLFEDGRVVRSLYKTRGCPAAIAAGSVLTGLVRGRDISALKALTTAQIDSAAGGLPAESMHAAVLCVDAVRAIVAAVMK